MKFCKSTEDMKNNENSSSKPKKHPKKTKPALIYGANNEFDEEYEFDDHHCVEI